MYGTERWSNSLCEVTAGWKRMEELGSHDFLQTIAEIERLIGKVYFRFSHLFIDHPTLRDFWWKLALAKERHAYNLTVMCAVVENEFGADRLGLRREKTDQLREALTAYLRTGIPAVAPGEAFRVARKMEARVKEVIDGDGLDAGSFPAGFLFSRGEIAMLLDPWRAIECHRP